MLTLAKKIGRRLIPVPERPREKILARGSEAERAAFFRASKYRNVPSLLARLTLRRLLSGRRLLGKLCRLAEDSQVTVPPMPRRQGYLICRPVNFPALENAVAEARAAFRHYRPGSNRRDHDSLEGVPRLDRSSNSAINKLAMHPEILSVVSRYLGYLPILYRINLLYSANDSQVDQSSQFFHLDPEDWTQVKIFLYVEDVDETSGPFILLPADKSQKVRRAVDYKGSRVSDEAMFGVVSEKDLVVCTAKAGTLVFADTSLCFHMGSRKGTRPRHAVMIQYVSPFAALFPLRGPIGNTPLGMDARPAQPTRLQRYLLGIKR